MKYAPAASKKYATVMRYLGNVSPVVLARNRSQPPFQGRFVSKREGDVTAQGRAGIASCPGLFSCHWTTTTKSCLSPAL